MDRAIELGKEPNRSDLKLEQIRMAEAKVSRHKPACCSRSNGVAATSKLMLGRCKRCSGRDPGAQWPSHARVLRVPARGLPYRRSGGTIGRCQVRHLSCL